MASALTLKTSGISCVRSMTGVAHGEGAPRPAVLLAALVEERCKVEVQP